ncbi:MAG: trigger factor [Chitinophagales bacterium]
MNVYQEKVGDLQSKIVIDLKKEDYEPQIKSSINKLGKQVSLKGFRPGMAPISLVKKMYGNSVLFEELNKILSDNVNKFLEENKIEILAQPLPAANQQVNWDINDLKDINFAFEIGHAPAFDLSYLDGAPTFTKYRIAAEEKMINDELDRLRKRHASYEYPELVGDNDIVALEYEELNEDGSLKEGGYRTSSSTLLEIVKPEFRSAIANLKKQDATTINVLEVFDRDKEGVAKFILNLKSAEELDALNPNFKITLVNITRSIPAELNEAFFTKAFGANGPKTEEEARTFIASDLEAYFDGRTDVFLVNDIYRAMMQHIEFPLPDAFLKRWIATTNDKPITQEQIETDYPTFSKQLRWDLITSRIAKEQNFEVKEEELLDKVRQETLQQLTQYGLTGMGYDWIEGFVQRQMKDKEYVRKAHDQVLDGKVIAFIKSKVSLAEQPITLDEFNAMVQKENAAVA